MKIPFVDLEAQYQSMQAEMDEAVLGVVRKNNFVNGEQVKRFEAQFADLYGAKHCISTANGTDSLFIALKMLGVGHGDEVITSAYSWISSSESISLLGAKPVFVDVDEFYSIDAEQIESKITAKTKVILPVHIHGQMCNMDKVMRIAKAHGLKVLEDCAQSHFSEFNGQRAGLIGDAGSFSFYPGKNLGAYGDAGALITNDDSLARNLRLFSKHGALKKHEHEMEGVNSRLDTIQAAVLLVKLPHIIRWTEQRRQVADWYNELLKGIDFIEKPMVRDNSKHSYHLYVVKCKRRDELRQFLSAKEISTGIHYPSALPNLKAYDYLGHNRADFPNASANESLMVSLPIFPEMTREMVEYVAEAIRSFK